MTCKSLAGFLSILVLCALSTAEPTSQHSPSTTQPDPIPDIDPAPKWDFDPTRAGLIQSIRACDYSVRVEVSPGPPHAITIEIMDKDKPLYSWKGNEWSVFVISGQEFPRQSGRYRSVLYYADFSGDKPGGEIVAVDLSTGKELWRTKLMALGQTRRSGGYSNRIGLSENEIELTIWSEETDGRYIECKSCESGETTSQHVYGQHPPSNRRTAKAVIVHLTRRLGLVVLLLVVILWLLAMSLYVRSKFRSDVVTIVTPGRHCAMLETADGLVEISWLSAWPGPRLIARTSRKVLSPRLDLSIIEPLAIICSASSSPNWRGFSYFHKPIALPYNNPDEGAVVPSWQEYVAKADSSRR